MPGRHYPDWESFDFAGPVDGPVAFGADLSPASVLGAYRRGIIPLPAADEYLRTINEFRYEDLVADGTIAGGWAHSIEVWLGDTLADGAIGIGIGGVISGDSLFGRHQGAARVAVADMAARLELAGGLLIDARWDSPFLRSLGADPVPREHYLPLLGHPAERIKLPSGPRPGRRLLGPG